MGWLIGIIIFMNIPDFFQSYIPKDAYLALGVFFGVPGFLFMIALGISILRTHFAIKRDGKEPPGLGPISLIELGFAFMVSECQFKKKMQHQAEHGVDLISVDYALIQPYIKPMDRLIARGWVFFGSLVCLLGFSYGWLYPELSS